MRKTTAHLNQIRRSEKVILSLIMICVFLIPVAIVYFQASLSSTNIEVEKLKEKIEEQENINTSLSMQVDELASLSNIQDIANSYGLSYNNNNIIVVK